MTTAGSSLSTTNDSDFMRGHLTAVLSTYRIWPVLILLLAGAALASGGIFLRPSNLVAMLFVAAPTTIAALGQTLVIMTAGIDLSVAAALGTLSICEGIARVYTGSSPILSVPPDYKALGGSYFGPVPLPTLILLTVVLLLIFIMHRMAIGKQVYAVGGNPVAARYASLPVTAVLIFVYAASGALAALAGLIQSAYVQEALTTVDFDTLFATIGGVVVGGTALTGGSGRLINTVGGVLVIVVVENTMNMLSVSPLLSEGVLGTIVLVAVYLNVGLNPRLLLAWFEAATKPIPPRP